MKKSGFSLSVLAAVMLFSAPNVLAEEAASGGMMRRISEKQDKILQALEEIKSELNVIKIRISSG